jgi:hypothetical protein
MISMLPLSAVDRGFKPDNKIGSIKEKEQRLADSISR